MENITEISFGPLPETSKCKPFRFYFNQNGVEKNWDLVNYDDSVTIIIYNKTSNKLVLIKQFEPRKEYAKQIVHAQLYANNSQIFSRLLCYCKRTWM